jgi:hypothetical protein
VVRSTIAAAAAIAAVLAPACHAICPKLMRPSASSLRQIALASVDRVVVRSPTRFAGAHGTCALRGAATNAAGPGWKHVVCSVSTRYGYRFVVTWSLRPTDCWVTYGIVRTR